NHPSPPYHQVKCLITPIIKYLHWECYEIVLDAAWALSYFSDRSASDVPPGEEPPVQGQHLIDLVSVNDGILLRRLMELVVHSDSQISTPCLRTLGNCVAGPDDICELTLNAGIIERLLILLNSELRYIRKECCWVISNIAAGTKAQRELLCTSGLIPMVVNCLRSPFADIRREAVWSFGNLIAHDDQYAMLKYAIDAGAVEGTCSMLETSDTNRDRKCIVVGLQFLRSCLQYGEDLGEDTNPICLRIESCGGLDTIEDLQQTSSYNVYDFAAGLIRDFFEADGSEDEMY
ncbi:hypothetical protein KIPB_004548, partial [Kipferlia bialata]